jgi:hypothetical protein
MVLMGEESMIKNMMTCQAPAALGDWSHPAQARLRLLHLLSIASMMLG